MGHYSAQGCPAVHLVAVVAPSMSSTSEHLGLESNSIVMVLGVCDPHVRFDEQNRRKRGADSFMARTAETCWLAMVWLIVAENSATCVCPHSIGTNSRLVLIE